MSVVVVLTNHVSAFRPSTFKRINFYSLYRDPDTEARVTSLLQPLALPRVSVKSSLSEAVWDEDRGRVVITRCRVETNYCKNVLNISGTREK